MKRVFFGALVVAAAVLVVALLRSGRPEPAAAPDGPGSAEGSRETLRIAAAADLRFALEDLTARFRHAHPTIAIAVSYGSSGNFYAQLMNQAPFDIFLSADVAYPRRLADQGFTLPGAEFTYAFGRIAVWVPAASPIDVEQLGLAALVAPSVAHVAIANPEHAPYGKAAESALRSAGLFDRVKDKLVFGENISQTLQFVQSGAADIGIVALSLARSPVVTTTGRFWEVPADAHPPLEQGGTILRWAANAGAAWTFRTFMVSAEAGTVLKRYGFVLPGA